VSETASGKRGGGGKWLSAPDSEHSGGGKPAAAEAAAALALVLRVEIPRETALGSGKLTIHRNSRKKLGKAGISAS